MPPPSGPPPPKPTGMPVARPPSDAPRGPPGPPLSPPQNANNPPLVGGQTPPPSAGAKIPPKTKPSQSYVPYPQTPDPTRYATPIQPQQGARGDQMNTSRATVMDRPGEGDPQYRSYVGTPAAGAHCLPEIFPFKNTHTVQVTYEISSVNFMFYDSLRVFEPWKKAELDTQFHKSIYGMVQFSLPGLAPQDVWLSVKAGMVNALLLTYQEQDRLKPTIVDSDWPIRIFVAVQVPAVHANRVASLLKDYCDTSAPFHEALQTYQNWYGRIAKGAQVKIVEDGTPATATGEEEFRQYTALSQQPRGGTGLTTVVGAREVRTIGPSERSASMYSQEPQLISSSTMSAPQWGVDTSPRGARRVGYTTQLNREYLPPAEFDREPRNAHFTGDRFWDRRERAPIERFQAAAYDAPPLPPPRGRNEESEVFEDDYGDVYVRIPPNRRYLF